MTCHLMDAHLAERGHVQEESRSTQMTSTCEWKGPAICLEMQPWNCGAWSSVPLAAALGGAAHACMQECVHPAAGCVCNALVRSGRCTAG